MVVSFLFCSCFSVNLPEAKTTKKQDQNKKETTIYVNAKGKIFLEKNKIDLKTLELKLSQIPKNQTVILRSDKASKFQDFVNVMDILKRLGHEQLYIVTKE